MNFIELTSPLMARAGFFKLRSLIRKTLVFFLFVAIDPFGLASVTSDISKQIVYRIVALYYPHAGAKHVSVVLIDDRSVTEINGERGYPLSFRQHASVLRPILCAGPAALFIDISFRGARPDPGEPDGSTSGMQAFATRLGTRPSKDDPYCKLPVQPEARPRQDTKVLLARTRSHPPSDCDPFYGLPLEGPSCALSRQIDTLKSVAQPTSVSPLRTDGGYLLVQQAPLAGGNEQPLEASPALKLVIEFCRTVTAVQREGVPGCRDLAKLEALLRPSTSERDRIIYPSWPFFQTAAYLQDQTQFAARSEPLTAQPVNCSELQQRAFPSYWERLTLASRELWRSALRMGHEGTAGMLDGKPCIPVDTFSARDVQSMAAYCGTTGDICEHRLATFFSGRLVLYGLDITGIHDTVESPVLGYVPGVVLHATIADNLLTWGAAYLRPPPEWTLGPLKLEATKLLDVVAFFLVCSLLISLSGKRRSPLGLLAMVVALAMIVVAGASLWLATRDAGIDIGLARFASALLVIFASMVIITLIEGAPAAAWWTRVGWHTTKVCIALPFLISFGAIAMMILEVHPLNLIGTLLIASSAAGETE